MKKKFIILLLFAFFQNEFLKANNYQEGDTLFVVAFSGLSVRNAPNADGEKIGRLNCKDSVMILNTFNFLQNKDTIEGFAGNWIYIKSKGLKGYVFDAFISTLPFVEDLDFYKKLNGNFNYIPEVLPDLLKEYSLRAFGDEGCEFQYQPAGEGESSHHFIIKKMNNNHSLIEHGYWEGGATELELFQKRDSEVYYLVKHLISLIPPSKLKLFESYLKEPMTIYNYGTCGVRGGIGDEDCLIQIYKKGENKTCIKFIFPCC